MTETMEQALDRLSAELRAVVASKLDENPWLSTHELKHLFTEAAEAENADRNAATMRQLIEGAGE